MRPDWDHYFLEIAHVIASRSTCLRRSVGAVITMDNRIIASGYNGPPSKLKHCAEVGCLREKLNIPSGTMHEICRGMHAEQNALVQAAVYGTPVKGGTIYVTCQPCVLCAKMIINAQINRIVYNGSYPDDLSKELLAEAAIEVVRLPKKGEE